MKRDLLTSLIAVVVLTVVLGIAYPLAITGISQLIFPGKANGSKLTLNGRTVGSSLIGQDFKGMPAYFQSRPSADRIFRRRDLLRQRRAEQRRRAGRGARKPRRLPPAQQAL